MPFIELPMTMPASGMTYCGRYHGSTCTMTPVTAKVTMKPVSAIDTNALREDARRRVGAALHEDARRHEHHEQEQPDDEPRRVDAEHPAQHVAEHEQLHVGAHRRDREVLRDAERQPDRDDADEHDEQRGERELPRADDDHAARRVGHDDHLALGRERAAGKPQPPRSQPVGAVVPDAHDRSAARGELARERRDRVRRRLVERRVRLVEQQHARLGEQHAHERDARGLPDREPRSVAVQRDVVEADAPERRAQRVVVGRGCPCRMRSVHGSSRLARTSPSTIAGFCGSKRDLGAPRAPGAICSAGTPSRRELGRRTGKQARERAQERGLAGAGRAHHVDELARAHRERDVVEHARRAGRRPA